MHAMKFYSHKRSEAGQSMVEMALAFVMLLILLAGVADLGRAYFTFMALRDASQEGAAYGSLNPSATTEIISHVRNSSTAPLNMNSGTITVNVQVGGAACQGSPITVTVTETNFPFMFPFTSNIIGSNSIAISAQTVDTILRPPCH